MKVQLVKEALTPVICKLNEVGVSNGFEYNGRYYVKMDGPYLNEKEREYKEFLCMDIRFLRSTILPANIEVKLVDLVVKAVECSEELKV